VSQGQEANIFISKYLGSKLAPCSRSNYTLAVTKKVEGNKLFTDILCALCSAFLHSLT